MAAPKYNPDFGDCNECDNVLPLLLHVRASQTGEDGIHEESLYRNDVLQLCIVNCFLFELWYFPKPLDVSWAQFNVTGR